MRAGCLSAYFCASLLTKVESSDFMNPPLQESPILGATEVEISGQYCLFYNKRSHWCSSLRVAIDCDFFPEDSISWELSMLLVRCYRFLILEFSNVFHSPPDLNVTAAVETCTVKAEIVYMTVMGHATDWCPQGNLWHPMYSPNSHPTPSLSFKEDEITCSHLCGNVCGDECLVIATWKYEWLYLEKDMMSNDFIVKLTHSFKAV